MKRYRIHAVWSPLIVYSAVCFQSDLEAFFFPKTPRWVEFLFFIVLSMKDEIFFVLEKK